MKGESHSKSVYINISYSFEFLKQSFSPLCTSIVIATGCSAGR